MASIWKGSVSFGLVHIPVTLQSAVREDKISFRMLEKDTLQPIKYKKTSSETQESIGLDQVVKGFEYEKGRYVVISEEDFAKAAVENSQMLEIENFVLQSEIDPRYFDKPYFLVPDKGAQRAYVLLREAMKETGMVAIGRITIRNKQHLAAIKPNDTALVINLMRFANELVSTNEYAFPEEADLKKPEMAMAKQLIEQHAETFDATKYQDQFRLNMEKIIQTKLKGQKIEKVSKSAPKDSGVVDLMEKLRDSLKRSKAGASAKDDELSESPKKAAKKAKGRSVSKSA